MSGFMPIHYFERVVALLGEPAGLVRNKRRSTITATSRASRIVCRATIDGPVSVVIDSRHDKRRNSGAQVTAAA